MVQSVELLFDREAEAALRAAWDALAGRDLPSLARHEGATNRPHVTVAVSEDGDLAPAVDGLRAVLAGWDVPRRGFAAVVGSPVLFGGHRNRWVLARQIVASRPLLTLHGAVHRAIAAQAPESVRSEQTLPDRWTAHVTLARRMPGDRLDEALQLIHAEPMPCHFVGARLWDSVTRTVTRLA